MHDGDVVRVDKELYGDVFRRPPKLTPLEARAIRLAIEYVGPTIAAEAHTPLERVRRKLEETFGRFDLAATPEPRDASDEETLVGVLSEAAEKRRVVELEYLKEGEEHPSVRRVEPYTIERELPVWRVHTWDLTVDAARTFRLDRMRSARLTDDSFEPRDGFDPSYLLNPRVARLLHSPAVARWKLERGARPLTDGSAIADVPYKTEEWLLSEVLADRGETVVVEPQRLRDLVAKRARRLQRELGPRPDRALGGRQRDREGRAAPRLGVDGQRPAVRLGDRPGDREPEAGARPRASRRMPRSKMRAWSSGGIPAPRSATERSTRSSSSTAPTMTSSPEGACTSAFATRLSRAWRSRERVRTQQREPILDERAHPRSAVARRQPRPCAPGPGVDLLELDRGWQRRR